MSNEVIFDNEIIQTSVYAASPVPESPKGLVAWMIENKIVDSNKQGNKYLLILVLVIMVTCVSIFVFSNYDFSNSPTQAQQQHQIQNVKLLMGL